MSKEQKLNASEKLELLLKKQTETDQKILILADEIDKLSKRLFQAESKLSATIKASTSEDAVNSIILESNTKELKNVVEQAVELGALVSSEIINTINSL